MGMKLPGGLEKFLHGVGHEWPMADEEKLFEMGRAWFNFAGELNQPVNDANSYAARVWSEQKGDAVSAFQGVWNDERAPHTNLLDGTTGGDIIGAGLMICAGIVLVLKINFIVQLTQLAIQICQAIASASVTFGVAGAQIPLSMEITSRLLDLCVTLAMNAVMGG